MLQLLHEGCASVRERGELREVKVIILKVQVLGTRERKDWEG